MTRNDYHFVSHWHVPGTVQEVTEVFRRAVDLPRWWPAAYLDAQEIEPGNENGLGYVAALHSKGWLPYTLRWQSKAVDIRHPYGFTIETTGDMVGRGVWTFQQDGDWVTMTYDWRISAEKPLLRYGAFLFKPLYQFNHRWAMKKGEESLTLELARRRARTPEERAAIPEPPRPTTTSPVPLLVAATLLLGTGVGLIYLIVRARR